MASDEISEEIRDLGIDGVSRMAAQSCWNFLSKSSCFRFSWYSLLEIRACFCGRWLDGKILFPPVLSLSSFLKQRASCAQRKRTVTPHPIRSFSFFSSLPAEERGWIKRTQLLNGGAHMGIYTMRERNGKRAVKTAVGFRSTYTRFCQRAFRLWLKHTNPLSIDFSLFFYLYSSREQTFSCAFKLFVDVVVIYLK